jgi:hypothetical protein
VSAATTPAPAVREKSIFDGLTAVLPLTAAYASLCVVYMVEAWLRVTPWLFSDELEMTQLSRSIAATGHAARRGEPYAAGTLYPYLTAPWWWIHDVTTAYAAIKYFDVFLMASVIFPTYLLARLVVDRTPALFAAIGAAAIPSLAYSSYIVEETVAYPYAALCLFLVTKALIDRRRRWITAAAVASVIAPGIRGELAMVPALALLALAFAWWSSDRERRRRGSWTVGDWTGVIVLVLGAIFVVSAYASRHYPEFERISRAYKDRIFTMGNWAAGSLAIGIGVVPFLAGLAVLLRASGEEPSRALRMFRSVSLAGIVTFGVYTAMKAAYLSTAFETRVEERNLIYIAPLLFVGTAIVLERRRVSLIGFGLAALYTLYLVGYALYHAVGSPYEMGIHLYSDALGVAILQAANRYVAWTPETARWAVLTMLLVGAVVLLAPRVARAQRVAGAAVGLLGVVILAWNVTGQISAAAGTISSSREYGASLGRPFTWVDDATGGRSTLYAGAGEKDQNAEWMLEFWNRSIERVTSLDGLTGGPGPAGGPDLAADGTISWGAPAQYDFAVQTKPCVDFAGRVVATHRYKAGGKKPEWQLVELTHPNRLQATCTGLYPDGWSGPADSQYYRFSGGTRGKLRVVISRRDWGGPTGPTPVHVRIGRLIINKNRQPIPGRVLRETTIMIDSTQTQVVWLRAPADRFAVQVAVDHKFVPAEYHVSSDERVLGAQIDYAFISRR